MLKLPNVPVSSLYAVLLAGTAAGGYIYAGRTR